LGGDCQPDKSGNCQDVAVGSFRNAGIEREFKIEQPADEDGVVAG
jgi:hypothetical protein